MEDDAQLLTSSYGIMYTQRRETSKRKWTLRLVLELCLVVCFITALSCAIGLGVRLQLHNRANGQALSPECVHAVGGGPVASGGGLDSAAPKQFSYCAQQLVAYAHPQQGAYWREVELAAADAMQVFGFSTPSLHDGSVALSQHNSSPYDRSAGLWQLLTKQEAIAGPQTQQRPSRHLLQLYGGVSIQQIQQVYEHQQQVEPEQSEQPQQFGGPVAATVGAQQSRASQRQVLEPPTPDRSKLVILDIDETLLSNMEQILDPQQWPWDKWVAAAQAPALQPVQQFYRALCAAGYSVAFVTGRREAQRDHTMQNLASAGYGSLCAETGSSKSGASVGAHSRGECCYTALYMRPQNDTRLASVYKPWARQQLLKTHKMQLLALVGDQFSDLNGDISAPYAFKLPNPFYYIL